MNLAGMRKMVNGTLIMSAMENAIIMKMIIGTMIMSAMETATTTTEIVIILEFREQTVIFLNFQFGAIHSEILLRLFFDIEGNFIIYVKNSLLKQKF